MANGTALQRAAALVAERLGMEMLSSPLEEALLERLRATGCPNVEGYLPRLEDPAGDELLALGERLRVGETYFFRHGEQLQAFLEVAIPECLKNDPTRAVRILSAGCASGEEAYTVAIMLKDRLPSVRFTLEAFDLSAVALARATAGHYGSWSLRAVSPEVRQRWFRPQGQDWALDESIRRAVSFQRRNLVGLSLTAAAYDIIFCRNVVMYFRPETARSTIAALARGLAAGGYLFLGHVETLRGLSRDFHLRQGCGSFFYQRLRDGERPTEAPVDVPAEWLSSPVAPPQTHRLTVDIDTSWVDAIRDSSARIAAVESSARRPTPIRGASEGDAEEADLETLLRRATSLINRGELPQAEEASRAALKLDEFCADAQYLLALCREHQGDSQGSIKYDRAALYLDPDFAMARLHLGRMCRRLGDRATAQRELREALKHLAGELEARIQLFGDGFGRQALIRLCEAELAASGGEP